MVSEKPALLITMWLPSWRFTSSTEFLTRNTIRLQCLPFCSLPLQEEGLRKLPFATNLERSEVLVPRAVRRLRLRFAPQFQLIKVFRRYLPVRDPIEQVLPENRRKIGPPNPRHQSPNVSRASSSFNRRRSAASRDSVSLSTSEKKRSFSASLDWRPASIKSTSTRLALVFFVLASARTRLAIPVGMDTL